MRGSLIRERLRQGEVLLGAWLSFTDPAVAEVMGDMGYDWLCIDSEHAPLPLDRLQNLLIGLKSAEVPVLVRAAWNDPVRIKQILDLGADGVVIPWVNTVEEAQLAVAACKYPPEGVRGLGPRRASGYGRNVLEYVKHANEEVFVTVQAETAQAAESIRGIMGVPGIDVVMIGPADLSMSLGLFGEYNHPQVKAAMEGILAAGKETGMPVGMFTNAETAKKWIPKGMQFVTLGGDNAFLQLGGRETLSAMRNWLGDAG